MVVGAKVLCELRNELYSEKHSKGNKESEEPSQGIRAVVFLVIFLYHNAFLSSLLCFYRNFTITRI